LEIAGYAVLPSAIRGKNGRRRRKKKNNNKNKAENRT
jgi:hypothetical protein